MISVREQVLVAFDAAIHAGLAGDGFGPVTRLERARQRAVDDGQRPAVVVVSAADDRPDVEGTGQDEYRMGVLVHGFVSAAAGASIEAAVNELYARIVRAALADPQLGGLADNLRHRGMNHDLTAQGGARTAEIIVEFEVDYATVEGDPFTAL